MRRKEEAIILPAGIGSDGGVVGERDREIEGESSARDSNKQGGSMRLPSQKTRQQTLSPGSVLLFPVQRHNDYQLGLMGSRGNDFEPTSKTSKRRRPSFASNDSPFRTRKRRRFVTTQEHSSSGYPRIVVCNKSKTTSLHRHRARIYLCLCGVGPLG